MWVREMLMTFTQKELKVNFGKILKKFLRNLGEIFCIIFEAFSNHFVEVKLLENFFGISGKFRVFLKNT